MDGPNLYLYAVNAPLRYLDSLGLFSVEASSAWGPGEVARMNLAKTQIQNSLSAFLEEVDKGPSASYGNPFKGESVFNHQCKLSDGIRTMLEEVLNQAILDQMKPKQQKVVFWRSSDPGVPNGKATFAQGAEYMVTDPDSNRIKVNVNIFRRDKWDPGAVDFLIIHESVHAVLDVRGHADGQTVPYSSSKQYFDSPIEKGDALARFYKDYVHGYSN